MNPDWIGSNNEFPGLTKGIEDAIEEKDPFATVAMVYNRSAAISQSPNAVTFYVFDGDDNLLHSSCARRRGRQNQPANVHGVSWWDLRLRHAFGHRCAVPAVRRVLLRAQLAGLDTRSTISRKGYRKLNALVNDTPPADAIADFINGTYNNAVQTPGTPAASRYQGSLPPTATCRRLGSRVRFRPIRIRFRHRRKPLQQRLPPVLPHVPHGQPRTPFLTFTEFKD